MKRTLGLTIGLLLIASPALSQKIAIDYADDFDFSQVVSLDVPLREVCQHSNRNARDNLLIHKQIQVHDDSIKCSSQFQVIKTSLGGFDIGFCRSFAPL